MDPRTPTSCTRATKRRLAVQPHRPPQVGLTGPRQRARSIVARGPISSLTRRLGLVGALWSISVSACEWAEGQMPPCVGHARSAGDECDADGQASAAAIDGDDGDTPDGGPDDRPADAGVDAACGPLSAGDWDCDESGAGGEAGSDSDEDASPVPDALDSGWNHPPTLSGPRDFELAEEVTRTLALEVDDLDGDEVRVWPFGLPPGATWHEPTHTLRWRPDFTQGGRTWDVVMMLDDGRARVAETLTLTVTDDHHPPPPTMTLLSATSTYRMYRLRQITDEFLDPPDRAGRSIDALLSVPVVAGEEWPVPVHVVLHGLGASPSIAGSSGEVRLAPHDPDNTYWWGMSEAWPDAPEGLVHPYTARRVLHLLDWTLAHVPGANPDRVFVSGSSMGGSGALNLGLLFGRHFAGAHIRVGQTIPLLHRPSRIATLSSRWGPVDAPLGDDEGVSPWMRMDATRALMEDPQARNQHISSEHGKDDATIHFGAVVLPSPLTGMSFHHALQQGRVGHLLVWDERGHGGSDPRLGPHWWDEGLSLRSDPVTFLRRGQAFIAFSACDADRDPGDGSGNGKRPWSQTSGFAGAVSVVGDTGWSGARAGALNRLLRWNAVTMIDSVDRFEVELGLQVGDGGPPPAAGEPTLGAWPDVSLPIHADVTPRRVQRFALRPGEAVVWQWRERQGLAYADEVGAVTIPALDLDEGWTRLRLRRAPRH